MNWTVFLKTEAARTYGATVQLIERVDPASLSWKPTTGSNWMTVGQLLKHLTEACGSSCKGFVTGDWGLPEGASVTDIPPEEMLLPPAEKLPAIENVGKALELLEADRKLAFEMIDVAGEEALANQQVEVFWAPGTKLPLGYRIFQMIQHLDRHKGQLFYYLKMQGVPVNTADLWGAEVEPEHAEERVMAHAH